MVGVGRRFPLLPPMGRPCTDQTPTPPPTPPYARARPSPLGLGPLRAQTQPFGGNVEMGETKRRLSLAHGAIEKASSPRRLRRERLKRNHRTLKNENQVIRHCRDHPYS